MRLTAPLCVTDIIIMLGHLKGSAVPDGASTAFTLYTRGYPDWDFSWLSSFAPSNIRGCALNDKLTGRK